MAKTKSKVRRVSGNNNNVMKYSEDALEVDCCPNQDVSGKILHNENFMHLGDPNLQCKMDMVKERTFSIGNTFDSGYSESFLKSTDETSDCIDSVCSSMDLVQIADFDEISDFEISHKRTKTIPQKKITFCSAVKDMYESDEDGDTQLHLAIINALTGIAIYIINSAPSVDWLNIPNKLLQTPLHLAVTVRSHEVVHWLLRRGADTHIRDRNGDTPLHIASRKGYDEIVKLLLDIRDGSFSKGLNQSLNSRNYDGKTCLHVASEGTHLPVINLLTQYGAGANVTDGKSGRTILHYATETGNMILLEYLLQIPEVDIHAKSYAGFTAIMLAQGRGYRDIVLRLLKAGAELDYTRADDSDSDDDQMDF